MISNIYLFIININKILHFYNFHIILSYLYTYILIINLLMTSVLRGLRKLDNKRFLFKKIHIWKALESL